MRVFDLLPTLVDTAATQGLAVSKLGPGAVAEALRRAMARDRHEVPVGRTAIVELINRFSPSVAERLVAQAMRSG